MKIADKIYTFIFKLFFLPGEKKMKKLIDDYIKKVRYIDVSKEGVVIQDVKKNIETNVKWNDVTDANYEIDKVTIYLSQEKRKIIIPLEYHENWYELIVKMPEGFLNYDYQAVKDFFIKLKNCEVCGLIAVDETDECLICGCEVWNSEMLKFYQTKNEYIKEMQFDFFEPINDDDKIEINNNHDSVFKPYKKWVQLVEEKDYKKDSVYNTIYRK